MSETLRQSELLSAYLDGEVTDAERAEVERMLEASPQMRAELDELGRIGTILRESPRQRAPEGLRTAIHQRMTERQGKKHRTGFRTTSPSGRRVSWGAVGGVIGGLLAICLAITIFVPGQPYSASQTSITDLRSESDRLPEAARDFSAEPAAAPAFDSVEGLDDRASERRSLPAPSAFGEISVDELVAAAPARDDVEEAAARMRAMSARSDFGTPAEVGVTSSHLESDGDDLRIVYVTVLDVDKAVDTFQTLLLRNSVPLSQPVSTGLGRSARDGLAVDLSRSNVRDARRQLAVFVESTEDRVAEAVDDAERNDLFVGWDSAVATAESAEAPTRELALREFAEKSRNLNMELERAVNTARPSVAQPSAAQQSVAQPTEAGVKSQELVADQNAESAGAELGKQKSGKDRQSGQSIRREQNLDLARSPNGQPEAGQAPTAPQPADAFSIEPERAIASDSLEDRGAVGSAVEIKPGMKPGLKPDQMKPLPSPVLRNTQQLVMIDETELPARRNIDRGSPMNRQRTDKRERLAARELLRHREELFAGSSDDADRKTSFNSNKDLAESAKKESAVAEVKGGRPVEAADESSSGSHAAAKEQSQNDSSKARPIRVLFVFETPTETPPIAGEVKAEVSKQRAVEAQSPTEAGVSDENK
ncbi:anti-sigma factor family protein [Stratiformator vulcanicus]|uniref:Putative zinc-finger domain-containing protein n=1 Tax=Stratiformator vulcanicus TaxID=2527980 RepID=A0A517R3G8_9PLAN|nr:zf-HC2 domain-containing protein [Stratiformator vulcanicus]QDT38439.1 hypothetical protein Pan189_28330 [Stratiformator vulcanicus]